MSSLSQLICEVYSIEKNQEKNEKIEKQEETTKKVNKYAYSSVHERYRIMISLLKEKGYWPSIQVKWFYDKSGLVMMYNTSKQIESTMDMPLYKEARSVVLNLGAEFPEHSIISSISNDIPTRMSNRAYRELYRATDSMESCYEGTTINVYHYNDKWYFSTTSCPNIDISRYFHPTKTHGMMFDEFLQTLFHIEDTEIYEENEKKAEEVAKETKQATISNTLRKRFVEHLDKTKSYLFVLVHHENKHVMDYSKQFGANYKELFHISTYSKGIEESIIEKPYEYLGLKYPIRFDIMDIAMLWLEKETSNYAIIVKREDKSILKICRDTVLLQEEMDLGNSNPWHNMLWIFLKNRPDYTVSTYAKQNKYTQVITESGKILSPTFVLHNTISFISSYIYDLYHKSTYYNLTTKELIFNGKLDKTYAPIMRFHMVQLRNIQKKYHTDRLVSLKIVADYLRYHQTMKNIRMLIAHFAKNPIDGINSECQFCIESLNTLLIDKL